MSERTVNRLRVALTLALATFVVVGLVTADPPEVDRAERIGSQVRCPVCAGESIADSSAGTARAMMDRTRELIDEGLTDEQVIDRLLVAFTDSQRLDPPLTARTAALWAIPAASLAVGLVVLVQQRRTRDEVTE